MLTFNELLDMVGEPVFVVSSPVGEGEWQILRGIRRSQDEYDSVTFYDNKYFYLKNLRLYRRREDYYQDEM